MIKSVDHFVPILLDMRNTYDPPNGVMRQFIAIHRTPHPRQGRIYVMGMNPIYEKLSKHLFDGAVDSTKSVQMVDSINDIIVPS